MLRLWLQSLLTIVCFSGFSSLSLADVLVKAQKHPPGRFESTNFTLYNDTTMVWTINGREGALFFAAGTQVAMPWNSTCRFPQGTVLSYDQRKLYEVEPGTVLTTPDYVPEVNLSRLPREEADEVHCVQYTYGKKETHCVVKTDKEDDEDDEAQGAYTSVNVSVSGNGRASASAKVEGCTAIANGSAVVVGSGSAKSSAVARAWGCND